MNRFVAARNRMRTDESGASLVENIIAVVILGVLGAAVLASVATLTSAGDRSRRSMRVAAAAQSAADAISSSTTPYVSCNPAAAAPYDQAPVASYQAVVNALSVSGAIPAGITVTVNPGIGQFNGSAFVPSTCFVNVEGDARRSQQIRVTATSDRASHSVTFVKREP